jgi:serine/threonine-protein kinase
MAGLGRLTYFAAVTPLLCLALHVSPARAQASASDKAAAEALFDQGLRLMKQNNFSDACPKLEESNRIDPAVGTLLYLGECFERVGKTASAWATFREAASLASNSNQADRARVASSRAQELESKLSRLSVELAPDVSRIPGVVVKRGTQRLEPSLYGTPLPVDPGEYRIEVSAPGYETWSTPITVGAAGASASVRVPQLVKAAAEAPATTEAPSTSAGPAPVVGVGAPPLSAVTDRGMSTQQTLGLVVGGVGLVGVGLGSYFGIRAISRNSDAEKDCNDDAKCRTSSAITLTNDARQDARFANIFMAAGGVLVATGAVLYLTGGSSSADRVALVPVVGPQLAAASVAGRF